MVCAATHLYPRVRRSPTPGYICYHCVSLNILWERNPHPVSNTLPLTIAVSIATLGGPRHGRSVVVGAGRSPSEKKKWTCTAYCDVCRQGALERLLRLDTDCLGRGCNWRGWVAHPPGRRLSCRPCSPSAPSLQSTDTVNLQQAEPRAGASVRCMYT